MSLFGSSPEDNTPSGSTQASAARGRSALFDEDIVPPSSSLFENDAHSDDPWSFSAPRTSRRVGLDQLLTESNAKIPEYYFSVFEVLLQQYPSRSRDAVSPDAIEKVLTEAELGNNSRDIVWNILGEKKDAWNRSEIWALLCMVGLISEGEEVSMDSIDDRRRNLPIPTLPGLSLPKKSFDSYSQRGSSADSTRSIPPSTLREQGSISSQPTRNTPSIGASMASSPHRNNNVFQASSLHDDPWGTSPTQHRPGPVGSSSVAALATSPNKPQLENRPNSIPIMNPVPQTLTGFPAALEDQHEPDDLQAQLAISPSRQTSAWGGYDGGAPDTSTLGGSSVRNANIRDSIRIPPPPTGQEETVTVTELPDMEGMFLFQHRNYQVACLRKGSRVVRRYSDFVWLLDCLHKRYPFRALPLLPPKALTANSSFLDRRRRGLVRFSNSLVRHPILSQEQLVVMFFTVPTELAVWRKQANLSIVDEFHNLQPSPILAQTLPQDLPATLNTIRSGVRKSAEHYISLCNLLDRLIKRNEGLAQDYQRLSYTLSALTDLSEATYAIDPNECPLLNDGLTTASRAYNSARDLLTEEGRSMSEHVLEDMKALRDSFVSLRDLFDRHEKLSVDARPALEKRIANNRRKMQALKAKPAPTNPQAQANLAEQLANLGKNIESDTLEIKRLADREVHIKATMVEEMNTFSRTVYSVGRMHQEWAQDRVKFAELTADVWRGLVNGLEGMPV